SHPRFVKSPHGCEESPCRSGLYQHLRSRGRGGNALRRLREERVRSGKGIGGPPPFHPIEKRVDPVRFLGSRGIAAYQLRDPFSRYQSSAPFFSLNRLF